MSQSTSSTRIRQLFCSDKTCEVVGDSFRLWDLVFKAIHEEDPTQEHCQRTQKLIESVMKHWRKYLKLSIIPKLHGIEAHLVRQMLLIDGGLARLIEHWVEQYHQVGRRYDLSYCRAGSLEKQAKLRSKLERRGRHPRVRMNKKRLEDVKKKRQHRHDRKQETKTGRSKERKAREGIGGDRGEA